MHGVQRLLAMQASPFECSGGRPSSFLIILEPYLEIHDGMASSEPWFTVPATYEYLLLKMGLGSSWELTAEDYAQIVST